MRHLKEVGSCLFEYAGDHIQITRDGHGQQASLRLTTRWDGEQRRCRLAVISSGRESVEFPHDHLWQAIQYIVEPFFFS